MLWWMSGIFYSCVFLTLALVGPFLWQYFFFFLISLPFSVLRALSPWGLLGLLKSFVSWLSKLLCLFIMAVHCCSVVSDSLWPHGLQHTRLPCPSLSPGVCSNSCPLSWWCHSIILSSVTLFCPQSFPASGYFQMSRLFTSGGPGIGTSAVRNVSVQLLSCVRLFASPWTAVRQASLSITNSWACSNSRPLSQWCHPTIISSVIPFSSCLQSFPASGSFPVSLNS